MSEFSIPYEFIAGTKAKAEEVNTNFNAVKNELSQKASKNGNATTNLSVANATLPEHAVNKSQLDLLSTTLSSKIDSKTISFCAKSGETTNGKADLFKNEKLIVAAKVGDGLSGNHKPLIIANCKGEFATKTVINQINMTGKTDGIYNIFCPLDGDAYVLKNTIYYKNTAPTMLENDVWLDLSTEPLKAVKYDGTDNVEFEDVPIGCVEIKNGTILTLTTNPYNQNGYNVTTLSEEWGKVLPDYTKGVDKTNGVFYVADKNGWLFVRAYSQNNAVIFIDGQSFELNTHHGSGAVTTGYCMPVGKNSTYSVAGSNLTKFYQAKGDV